MDSHDAMLTDLLAKADHPGQVAEKMLPHTQAILGDMDRYGVQAGSGGVPTPGEVFPAFQIAELHERVQVKTRVQEPRLQDRVHERVQEHIQREGAARREEPVAEEVYPTDEQAPT